jgi:cathepsin A (carboxypeptidase C)
VYALLTLFFKQFPEYAKQDFHIAGESYAGHYIPVFTAEILAHKKRNINLKSVLIGNGLTDGLTQYGYYRPMACGGGGYPAILDESECQAMDNALPRCTSLIQSCYDSDSVWSCVPASICEFQSTIQIRNSHTASAHKLYFAIAKKRHITFLCNF